MRRTWLAQLALLLAAAGVMAAVAVGALERVSRHVTEQRRAAAGWVQNPAPQPRAKW